MGHHQSKARIFNISQIIHKKSGPLIHWLNKPSVKQPTIPIICDMCVFKVKQAFSYSQYLEKPKNWPYRKVILI